VPTSRWSPPRRTMPAAINEPSYDPDHEVRRVRRTGEIKWRGEHIFIGEAVARETVGTEGSSIAPAGSIASLRPVRSCAKRRNRLWNNLESVSPPVKDREGFKRRGSEMIGRSRTCALPGPRATRPLPQFNSSFASGDTKMTTSATRRRSIIWRSSRISTDRSARRRRTTGKRSASSTSRGRAITGCSATSRTILPP
jgi:hypothetical protein